MMSYRLSGPIRFGAAAVLLLLAGCAGEAAPGPSPTPVAAATAAGPPGWRDGEYQGTRSPESGSPECGFESAVGYDVSGTTIRLRTHKQSRALSGAIDPSGRFVLAGADGQAQVVGVIRGDRLTATETRPPHHHRHSVTEATHGLVCSAQIEANRVADTP